MPTKVFGSNFYAGSCATCGVRVAKDGGLAGVIDGTKVTWCLTHRPAPAAPAAQATPVVQVSLDGGQLSLGLVGRYPRDVFDSYLAAKRAGGVRSSQVAGQWRDTCAIAQAGGVVRALEAAGFAVQTAPAAAEAIRGAVAQQQAEQAATQTRLAHPQAAGLFGFQRTGVEWLASRTGALLSDEMGCIDGSAEIVCQRAGRTFRLSLFDLFQKFNGLSGRWDLTIPTHARALCDGYFRQHKIERVLDKGVRPVVKLTLASGKVLRLTPDHEVARLDGQWTPAEGLREGDVVLTNGTPACSECGGVDRVTTYPYAKFRGICRTCIYATKRKNGRFVTGKFIDRDGYVRVSGHKHHPRANRSGSVYEHILVMERVLGRLIGRESHVHHINGNKADNRPENLQVLPAPVHQAHHGREGGFAHFDGAVTGKGGVAVMLPKQDRVVSVVPDGEARVFDIVMADPYRNFVANGVVVHNCGKTVQALMALGEDRPVLLVVPASLKLNWAKEAARWRPEYRVSVLEGRDSFRWPANGEIVIVNYDILPAAPETWRGYGALPALEGALAGAPRRLVVIADEAHSVKNPKAQRTTRFRLLGEIARRGGGQTWLLTGTPLLNRPIELWNVAQSGGLATEAFGSFDRFKRLFNAEDGRFGIEWGEPEPEVPELLRRIQLRREKKDVLSDLPAKTRKVVPVAVEIGKRDRAALDKALVALNDKIKTSPTVSAEDARSVPAFPAFEQFSAALTKLSILKTEAAIEYCETFLEEGVPFLVFSAHLEPLYAAKAAIEKAGKRCGLIVGDVSAEERQQVVEDFQAGKLDAVCLSIQAGGVGLTLTRATDSVFIDLSVVPALNIQAEDRIHRIGQRSATTIHQLRLDHPLDERIFEILARKTELFEAAVGASTLLPTEQAPANGAAEALAQAAAGLVVADATAADEEPVPTSTVRSVTYTQGSRRRTVVVPEQARPARDARERWAADAIQTLTELDPDRAAEDNGAGWSASDGSTGHALAALLRAGHGLTDAQWEASLHLLGRYWRQVGRAPARDTDRTPGESSREEEEGQQEEEEEGQQVGA